MEYIRTKRAIMEYIEISIAVTLGVVGFLGWLLREKLTQLEMTERRVTVLETKLNVLGDINEVLGTLKTDVAVIKNSLARKHDKAE